MNEDLEQYRDPDSQRQYDEVNSKLFASTSSARSVFRYLMDKHGHFFTPVIKEMESSYIDPKDTMSKENLDRNIYFLAKTVCYYLKIYEPEEYASLYRSVYQEKEGNSKTVEPVNSTSSEGFDIADIDKRIAALEYIPESEETRKLLKQFNEMPEPPQDAV